MRHLTRTTALVGVLFAVTTALAGCGVVQVNTAPQGFTVPGPTGSFATAPIGTVVQVASGGVDTTVNVTAYSTVVLGAQNQESLPSGTAVALLHAQQCLTYDPTGQGVKMTWGAWTLVTASHATVKPLATASASDFSGQALYNNDSNKIVHAGTCVDGLIPFSLAQVSGQITMAHYSALGEVFLWQLQ